MFRRLLLAGVVALGFLCPVAVTTANAHEHHGCGCGYEPYYRDYCDRGCDYGRCDCRSYQPPVCYPQDYCYRDYYPRSYCYREYYPRDYCRRDYCDRGCYRGDYCHRR